uniref:HIT domain-containing protein n=1 Tax=Anopheles minimus TaxID=112268 RepID=A0A182WIY5_9DIPT
MLVATVRPLAIRTLQSVCHMVRFRSQDSGGSQNSPKPAVKHPDTIFDKIIKKEIAADLIYEDEKCIAFNDISPQAPVHFLVIPKQKIDKLENSTTGQVELLGHLLHVAGQLGKSKAPEGFRLVINNGENGCQTVYHIHLHSTMSDQTSNSFLSYRDLPVSAAVGKGAEMNVTNSCSPGQSSQMEGKPDIVVPKISFPISPTYAQDGPEDDSSGSSRNKLKIRKDHRMEARPAPYLTVRPSALHVSRLLEAVSHNNTDKVKEMIQQGMSPNTSECYFNRSVLHVACSRGYRDIVQFLLERGADPNIRDKNLNTPLHLAASTESVEVIQLLLQYGTNVLLRDSSGLLALDFSIGKLRLSERIITKMHLLTQSDIHKHRQNTVEICERIFCAFKQQIRERDAQSHGFDQAKLEQMLNDFSEQLDKVRSRKIDLEALVDKIGNLKVINEIDSDVSSLQTTLQKITL